MDFRDKLRDIDQNTWLINLGVILLLVGLFIIYRGRNGEKDTRLDPHVTSLEELINPFTYLIAWLATKLPVWVWGLFPIFLSFYLFYLAFQSPA